MIYVYVKRVGADWVRERIITPDQLHQVMCELSQMLDVEGVDVTHPDGSEYRHNHATP